MSYRYTEFDGVSLPAFNHSQNHSPMMAESALRDSVGGAYDWSGTNRRKGRKQPISLTGVFVGELTYLTNEAGDYLVDESGNYIIAGDAEQMLGAQVAPLLLKVGTRGSLWRKRLADDVLEWKTARLLQVNWPRKWDDHAIRAEITCQFETAMEYWHASTITTTSASALNGVAKNMNLSNSGATIEDATFTVTRTSGTITAVYVSSTDLGLAFSWTGALGSGEVLTIDDGADTVRKGSTDSYSGFNLSGLHTASTWLTITQGTSLVYVTVVGGNATVAFNYYVQLP